MLPVLWFRNWKKKELFPIYLITKLLDARNTFTMNQNVCLSPYMYAYYVTALIMCLTNQNNFISEPPINFWLVTKFTWCYNFGSEMLIGPNTWTDFRAELEQFRPYFPITQTSRSTCLLSMLLSVYFIFRNDFFTSVQIISTLNVLDITLRSFVTIDHWQSDFQYCLRTISIPNFTDPATAVRPKDSASLRGSQHVIFAFHKT